MRRLAHAFVAMALAAMPTTGMAAEATPPPSADHRDGEKVTIYFGPDRYDLPALDMGSGPSAEPQTPEHTKALSFMFLLPDMRPAALDPTEARMLGWHNQVTALFEYGRNFLPVGVRFDHYMQAAKLKDFKLVPDVNSCDTYKGQFVTTDDLRVCNDGGRVFIAECSGRFPWEKYPDCNIYDNISDKATVIITFAKAHVDRILDMERFVFNYLPSHKR